MLMVFMVTVPCLSGPWPIGLGPTSDWFSTGTYRDTGYHWMLWADAMIGGGQGTGDTFYVDSNVASAGDGQSWSSAKETWDEAIVLCAANNGDIIEIASGHAETWTAANSAAMDVIGVSVIGHGEGTDRPTFTYTAAGELVFSVANCRVTNLVFSPGAANVTHAIEVAAGGDNTIIEMCEFTSGATDAFEFVDAIDVASAADDLTVRFCRQIETTAGAASWLDLTAGACDNLQIYGNNVYGDYSTSAVAGSTHAHLLGYYGFNTITNINTAELVLDFQGNATGVIEHNRIFADTQAALDPGIMMCFENYVSTVIDTSGQIYPAYDDGTTQLNATSVTAIQTSIDALTGWGLRASCDTNASAATVDCTELDGFGDDYFNTGWSLICIHDHDAPGTLQEGEIRDIEDYSSTLGIFTVDPDFSAAITADDDILVVRTEQLNPHMPAAAGSSSKNIWYCDDGGSAGDGKTWKTASITLKAAEALMAAGDICYIGANHTEHISAADAVILNLAGSQFIGMGEGTTRPQMIMEDTAGEITLSAAGIILKNLQIIPDATVTASGVRVEAAGIGCTIENCHFGDGSDADDEFVDCISVDTTAANLTVKNCTYENSNRTAEHTNTFVNLDEATIANCSIIGCTVYGDFAEAPIWSDAVPTNLLIKDNVISNTNSGDLCIEFQDAATGACVSNVLNGDTYGSILDPGSMKCSGNTQTVGINSAAIDVPLVAGQTYALTKADGTAHTDTLFSVTGGPILITSFTGYCITEIGGTVTMTIILDHATTGDREFSSAVDINALAAGGLLIFTEANPAVLTIVAIGANAGGSQLMDPWYCPVGMIGNTNDDPTQTGVISWSMTFIPLTDGVTVIPQ